MIRVTIAAFAALFLVPLFALPSRASTATRNPCTLLTVAEVSKAFGQRSGPGKLQPGESLPTCGWFNASQSRTLFVGYATHSTMPPPWWKTAVPVRGVADRALWSSGWMYITERGTSVAIELILSAKSVQHMDPQIVVLAKDIAARLRSG